MGCGAQAIHPIQTYPISHSPDKINIEIPLGAALIMRIGYYVTLLAARLARILWLGTLNDGVFGGMRNSNKCKAVHRHWIQVKPVKVISTTIQPSPKISVVGSSHMQICSVSKFD